MGRLPERDTRAGATNSRFKWRPSNAAIAVVFLLIFTIGPYLAFTGHVPFTSYGYELKATFSNGVNISTNSPVRVLNHWVFWDSRRWLGWRMRGPPRGR